MQDPVKLALSIGFSHAGIIDPSKLRALPEVRDMCADGRCRRYNRCWSCPPACGTLEEAEARMHRYRCGVLVQTTAELEDDFDMEAACPWVPEAVLSVRPAPIPTVRAVSRKRCSPPWKPVVSWSTKPAPWQV